MSNLLLAVIGALGTLVLIHQGTEGGTRRVLLASVSVIWAAHILSDVVLAMREGW